MDVWKCLLFMGFLFCIVFLHFFFKIDTMDIPKWGYPFLFLAGVFSGWVHEGLTVGVSGCLFFISVSTGLNSEEI